MSDARSDSGFAAGDGAKAGCRPESAASGAWEPPTYVTLNEAQFAKFMAVIENPPEPTEALKQLMRSAPPWAKPGAVTRQQLIDAMFARAGKGSLHDGGCTLGDYADAILALLARTSPTAVTKVGSGGARETLAAKSQNNDAEDNVSIPVGLPRENKGLEGE